MHANLHMHRDISSGQVAYLSDARRYIPHPDPGTAGDGFVLDPEFDHIIPRNRAGVLPGPTMFSNLQITSPVYNSQKSNHLWVVPECIVGQVRPILQNTRGALKRSSDAGDDNPKLAKGGIKAYSP